MAEHAAIAGGPLASREPGGFALRYGLAIFGTYFAVLPPTLGGLSIRVQELAGLAEAARQLGLITGIGFLFALLTQPVVGRLSDRTRLRIGMRKPWILLGTAGFMASVCGIGLAGDLTSLLVFWCLAQISSNMVQGSLLATVADQVPAGRLGLVSGVGGAAIPLAMLASAASLQALPTNALRMALPALVGGALCLMFALALKDRVLARQERARDPAESAARPGFDPRLYRDFALAWAAKACIMLGFASIATYLTLFLGRAYRMGIAEQLQFNLYATATSVAMMVLGSVLGGWVSNRLGRRRILVLVAGMLIGAGVALLGASPLFGMRYGLGLLLLGEAIMGAGFGLFLAVDAALCVDVAPNPAAKARDLGILSIANSLPGTIAPFIAGAAIIPLGDAIADGFGFTLWFFVAAAIAFAGAQLVLLIRSVR